MKILYFDCYAGISGDMVLGALINLGVDSKWLESELAKLNLSGYSLKIEPCTKKGISGIRCRVCLADARGQDAVDPGLLSHELEHQQHRHDQCHDHGDHHHHHSHSHSNQHSHQSYTGIRALIDESSLNPEVKATALRIFQRIAQAEAKVHGKTLENVHFHEVGAIDSIVDIVGISLCLHALAPDQILCSPVHTGSGFIRCAHGLMPIPTPATSEILADSDIKAYATTLEGEFTTPTGAAVLAEMAMPHDKLPLMRVLKTGYGAGTKDYEIPNMLRVFLGDIQDHAEV